MSDDEQGPAHRPYPGQDFVLVVDFMKALHAAGLLPQYPSCSRVVIDADIYDGIVKMYVDQIPSGALLTIPLLMNPSQPTEPERQT